MHKHPIHAALAALGLCCAATQAPAAAADHQQPALGPEARMQLAELRAATAPYHDFDVATAEGLWDTPITACLSSPDGAMGYHYANLGNFGVHEPAYPQALLFEPRKDGSMRLVGVEYIVVDGGTAGVADSPPPAPLFGQDFHYVPAFDVWGLHVWAWRHNPAGMFAAWNPDVSCEYGVQP